MRAQIYWTQTESVILPMDSRLGTEIRGKGGEMAHPLLTCYGDMTQGFTDI